MTEATHFRYSAGDEPIAGYVLVQRLGQGASGSVWKAQGPGKTIALKIVDLKQKIGQKELRALKRVKDINHPNLVPIFAFWLKDSSGRTIDHDLLLDQLSDESSASGSASRKAIQLIIAMGLGESTLGDHLRACRKGGAGGIPRDELLDHIDSAARAIDHLNLHYGIQHGDVKPTNILLVGGGIQVCDFGLACAVRDDLCQTTAGYSPAYAAPELIADDLSTNRSDQYALAVTFVELLTGRLPFPVEPEDLYQAKTRGRIALDGLNQADRRIIQRATAVDPSQRYETCVEMIKALRTTGSSALDGLTGYRPEYEAGDIPVPGYRLVQALGIGGAGQVWKATRAGVEVALKIVNLDRNIGQKELQALRLVKEYKHPNLIPIHGFWLKDDTDTIRDGSQVDLAAPNASPPARETSASGAMDKTVDLSTPPADGTVDVSGRTPVADPSRTTPVGPIDSNAVVQRSTQLIIAMGLGDATLADRLTECDDENLQGIPRQEILDYLHGAAEAIDLLNEKGIQHCDIKPTNILMVGRGEDVQGGVQVCDFGLAQAVGSDRSQSSPAYSPPYAAPELMTGAGPSATTDQFSLAVTYVELRTNEIPYPCDSLKKLKAAKLAGQIDLSRLSRRDRRVIRRACSLDPDRRYRNTRQMIASLRRRSLMVPIVIEVLMVIALAGFIFYPRPNTDGLTLERIATHLEASDYWMAWARTGDLEDDTDRDKSRRRVVGAWEDAILSAAKGNVDREAESIHDNCNQLLGAESEHPRAAFAGPRIFVLRARARARLQQWDEALFDLTRASESLGNLEASDPAVAHHSLLTAIHRCAIDKSSDADAIGNDDDLLARIEQIHQRRDQLTTEHWEPWDEQLFDQLIDAVIAGAEQLDESTAAFAKLSELIRRVTGAPADREILLERVARLVNSGSVEDLQRCETILAGLAARYEDDESRQLFDKHRCLVRMTDPATPWDVALDSLERLETALPQDTGHDDSNHVGLLSAMKQRLRREALTVPTRVAYPMVQRHCNLYRARNPNDLDTNMCWLEAAIERHLSDGQAIPDDIHLVLQALTRQLADLPPEQRAYYLYVRSLTLYHTGEAQDTGSDLVLVADEDSDPWLTPHRRQRMVDILLASSAALISEPLTGPDDASDVHLNQPSAAAAKQANRLSATAYRLSSETDPKQETYKHLLRIRALAAYYGGAIDQHDLTWDDDVIRLLGEYETLQGELDGKLSLIRALSYAHDTEPSDIGPSLEAFADVLQTWFKSIETQSLRTPEGTPGRIRYDDNKQSVIICRQVIEPALAIADLPQVTNADHPSEIKLPDLPPVMRTVSRELASILALKGYLLLTDHDVRRFYETGVSPSDPGGAASQAYRAYLWANSIDPGNEQHLFGLGLAFHALPNVSQAEKIPGLNWVVQQADRYDIRSPKVRGLRGFVNALKARDAVSLADKSRFYQAARNDFRQALAQASGLSDHDRLVFEPSYLVSLSSVDLELAFVREKRERQRDQARKLLNEAIRVADRATRLDWASAPELPWVSKGNAQEDMALYVRDGEENYVESIKSFSKARDIAFRHWRSTKLATLSRERCRFRLISSDPDEPTLRKIARDLSKAHTGKEAIDWEITFWIGQTYRLLAERHNNPEDIERARQAYQRASQSAQGKTHDWPVYNVGWAEFELSQKDNERAAELAREVIRLGVENVRDDLFLRAIPIAFQGQPAETVAGEIEAYLTKTQQRPFMEAELRLMRAPLWVQAARDDTDQAARFLRRAYQDCKAVRDWARQDLQDMPESETHFRARAVAWIGGVMSNYDFLELLDDDDRQSTVDTLRTDLDQAIRDLIKEDRPSSAEPLRTADGVWKYFFGEPHSELK